MTATGRTYDYSANQSANARTVLIFLALVTVIAFTVLCLVSTIQRGWFFAAPYTAVMVAAFIAPFFFACTTAASGKEWRHLMRERSYLYICAIYGAWSVVGTITMGPLHPILLVIIASCGWGVGKLELYEEEFEE